MAEAANGKGEDAEVDAADEKDEEDQVKEEKEEKEDVEAENGDKGGDAETKGEAKAAVNGAGADDKAEDD